MFDDTQLAGWVKDAIAKNPALASDILNAVAAGFSSSDIDR